jgi:hypothetical protein
MLACALATIAPLFAAKYLPFSDLAEHVAAIATLRHWYDPLWHDAQIYEFQGLKSPYLAYHAAGAALAFVTDDANSANRWLLVACGLALPYAMRSLIGAFGGDRRVALLACPLFWSRPLLIGFLPFVAAIPIALYALALVVRQTAEPSLRRGAALAVLALLLFYVHLDAFVLVAVVAVALHFVMPRATNETFARRLVALPPRLAWLSGGALAAIVWHHRAEADGNPALLFGRDVRFTPARELTSEFSAWAHDIWKSHLDEGTGVAFWLLVLLLAWQHGQPEPHGVRGVAARWTPFACALALFVIVPNRIGTGAMLNVRLAVFLGLFALAVLRPDRRALTSYVLGAGALLTFVVAGNAAFEIRSAERDELAGFDALIDRVTPGSKLLALEFDRSSAHTDFAPWIHVGAYHRIRRGGVASFSFAELPHWPVRYRPEARPPHAKARFLEWKPCLFRNAVDGGYYDFVLTRGTIDPFAYDPPGPRWRVIGAALDWRLFAKVEDREVDPNAQDDGPCAAKGP